MHQIASNMIKKCNGFSKNIKNIANMKNLTEFPYLKLDLNVKAKVESKNW